MRADPRRDPARNLRVQGVELARAELPQAPPPRRPDVDCREDAMTTPGERARGSITCVAAPPRRTSSLGVCSMLRRMKLCRCWGGGIASRLER